VKRSVVIAPLLLGACSVWFNPDRVKVTTCEPLPVVPRFAPAPVPPQTKVRTAVIEDPHAELPALLAGWIIPASHEPDHYALVLAAMLLGDGESSRLRRAFVRERGLAIEVAAQTGDRRGPDMFEVVVKMAGGGGRIDHVTRLLEAELGDLARRGPTAAEMTKLRNRIRARFLLGLQSNFARAQELAEMELYRGDATLLNVELDKYLAVTSSDVARVVAEHLTTSRRSLVEVKPARSGGTK
jgi:predicted Zn-dependent peptidase